MSESSAAERQLSVHELGFLDLDTPKRHQVVSGVVFLSGPIDIKTIWQRLHRFVNANPRYRCRIVGKRSPEWKTDETFDIDSHLIEIELNESSTEDILTFVSNQAADGLAGDRPPWRAAYIRASGEHSRPDRFAIAIWAHHALLDGLGGMKLYSSLLDSRSNTSRVDSRSNTSEVVDSPGSQSLVSASCVRIVARDALRRRISGLLSGCRSARRTTLAFTWPRQAFAIAKRMHDASFQELLLAVLSAGLSNYCERHARRPKLRAVLPLGRTGTGVMITRRNVCVSIQIDPEVICDPLNLKADLAHAFAGIRPPANSSSAAASVHFDSPIRFCETGAPWLS